MFFIQVVRGRRGGRLKVCGKGSELYPSLFQKDDISN